MASWSVSGPWMMSSFLPQTSSFVGKPHTFNHYRKTMYRDEQKKTWKVEPMVSRVVHAWWVIRSLLASNVKLFILVISTHRVIDIHNKVWRLAESYDGWISYWIDVKGKLHWHVANRISRCQRRVSSSIGQLVRQLGCQSPFSADTTRWRAGFLVCDHFFSLKNSYGFWKNLTSEVSLALLPNPKSQLGNLC